MPVLDPPLLEYNKNMALTSEQTNLLELPISSKLFLQGAAGTGKTTTGTRWLKRLLQSGIPAHEILVFVPQRTLAKPYEESLREDLDLPQSLVTTITLGGLARRMVDLFWPIVSGESGVANPNFPPHFLTLETAQYYMAHLVKPLIEKEGFFESLTINRNRIYSQILDNLNKAAIVGFPMNEIGQRLKSAWVGDIDQLHIYDDVQNCVDRFRAFCLENNLLDFSLQVEVFVKHLWPSSICRNYLTRVYRHLVVDNVEEDTPVSHDILREWIPEFDSALVIFDQDAGYRFFLGADVHSAYALRKSCEKTLTFQENLVNELGISQLKNGIQHTIARLTGKSSEASPANFNAIITALGTPEENPRYFPAMVNWVTGQIKHLVDEGTPPGEIVVLAPFMSDVLRFTLSNQLDELGIPHHSHRPSRSLRDEPATQTLLTLAMVAFPFWDLLPKRINLAFALMQVIDGLDLVRAQLLTAYIYNDRSEGFPLKPFEDVPAEIRERVTYRVGEHYDRLRQWLESAKANDALTLDFFLNRMFGEVLSQPGYGFHDDLNNANTIANLIESIQKFRWAIGNQLGSDIFSIGKEYVQMVADGVIAAQYIQSWHHQEADSVFLAPAYTFLISNQPVDVQFWLDIGSPSWYQRLDQPLTQPYVLSRNWQEGEVWDADDELEAAHDTLNRLSLGLLSRCCKKIFLGMSEMDVRGFENRGLLLRIFQHVLLEARRKTP
jgi:superfamily I DNA/RNA helicase